MLGGCQAGYGSYEQVLRPVSDPDFRDAGLAKQSRGTFSCRPLRIETAVFNAFSSLGIWLSAGAHLHIIPGLQIHPRLLRQKSFHFSS